MFYVSSVFLLHGVYGATLYSIAWLLSDSVFAGMIAVTLFVIHRYSLSDLDIHVAYAALDKLKKKTLFKSDSIHNS